MLVCVSSHNFAHETAGAARTRSSLRPLFSKGGILQDKLVQVMRRDREIVFVNERATLSLVIARACGRSSIPETPVIEPRSPGVLDTPHARSMTASSGEAQRANLSNDKLLRRRLIAACTT